VFINLDSNPQTLETYLGPVVPRHFERYKCGEKWKRIHFGVEVPCNWKIVAEAFMETYHIP
jgi:phenylpropionate dioxygenase-like ring-hydroxylating dioxygenase large terminal subunit